MAGRIRFVQVLHSHQPVGNFDSVIEDAYRQSYLPYIEAYEAFPAVAPTLHYSGCLLEWLEKHHYEYFERIRRRVESEDTKPWEMLGGAMMEPILVMLHARDRHGQIEMMADYLEEHFGQRPAGVWLAERVYEPGLVHDLAEVDVEYLTLDDSHFLAAGLREDELIGGYRTEDEGYTTTIYPASERLRYLIPFAPVDEVMQYLRGLVPHEGERVVCYADDGEKFGVWPETFKHVFEHGWLKQFLSALTQAEEEGWLINSTLSAAHEEIPPIGLTYLPENSYREMTEWALPAPALANLTYNLDELENDGRFQAIKRHLKGGNWRAFRVKYPEGNKLHAKMMEVSDLFEALPEGVKQSDEGRQAQMHLYRGQCNCPYWHGVFGGMYLPHLRSAVYSELIRAEKAIERLSPDEDKISYGDFDFDGQDEYKLCNEMLALYLKPSRGGHLYEFDVRDIAFNVGDVFSRRYEAYHDKVAEAPTSADGSTSSIHGLILAKEEGLGELLKYDRYLRESLVDHLSPVPLTTDAMLSGEPPSDPGFRQGRYTPHLDYGILKKGGVMSTLILAREAEWNGRPISVRKEIKLQEESVFTVAYEIKALDEGELNGWFAVEMNYGLLAGDAHDRYFALEDHDNVGPLAQIRDFGPQKWIGLKDHWLNVAFYLKSSIAAQVLVSPVKTVSQSESGFESVYQSSSVVLQWQLNLQPGTALKFVLEQEVGRAH